MQLMQVYSQKSISSTLPRNRAIVRGGELIHATFAPVVTSSSAFGRSPRVPRTEPGAGAVRGTRGERPNAEEEVTTGANVAWINSPPITIARLRGNVLLIDFWEYTCINCIRTFPENKKWYERYHKYGFTIIGVHDPEFDIAYSPAHVREAVKRFGLPYPVVVDSNFLIWRAYK